MGELVVAGAMLQCPFGTAPSTLNVTSQATCTAAGQPVATIQDAQGMVNIPSFGMCTSLANPQVAAATAAALGVLTPQPCMPVTSGAWIPTSPTTLVAGKPCLTGDCKAICTNGMGNITVTQPGQMLVSTR